MMEPDRIRKLAQAAQRGDGNAFDELCESFRPSVFAHAASVLGDFHLAQDATQETLLTAYFALPRLEEPAAFAGWLQTITRRQINRLLRRRDLQLVLTDSLESFESSTTSPAINAEQRETHSTIASLIDALSPSDREIVRLFYLHNCSQREVAAFLGLPVTTINNRLHIARRTMKERMTAMTTGITNEQSQNQEPSNRIGEIIRIDGAIIDVRFGPQHTPDIFDALVVADSSGLAVERMKVAQRRDNCNVRCLATSSGTDLKPGMKVMNSGALGLGLTPQVGVAPMSDDEIARVVRSSPTLAKPQLLETGIKPIDLLCPLTVGGTLGLFGIQGVGRIVLVEELMRRLRDSAGVKISYLVEPNEPDSVRGMLTTEKEYPGDVVGNVEVMWLLTEAATDPDFAATNDLFDATIYCSPLIGIQGLYPAIDPLASRSRLLRAELVGAEHFEVAARVRETITLARELMTDPVLLQLLACRARSKARSRAIDFPRTRIAQLNVDDRLLVSRARKLERFLTTPFFVAEPFSNKPGQRVSLEETITGCRKILEGKLDDRPEESLMYIGEIGQAA